MFEKKKILKALFCLFLGFTAMGGANMDPKEIEELMRTMNQTRIEFTIPDKNDKGESN